MKTKEKKEVWLHRVMCVIGGFICAYSVLTRTDILGSAQTSNMMEILFGIFGRDYKEVVIRLGAFFLYCGAMILVLVLTKKIRLNLSWYVVFVQILCIGILFFLPADVNPVLALYPAFFMTATQWSVFHGVKGYNCSTIFSTNNLKQTILGFGEYWMTKDEKALDQGKFFGSSLLFFYSGAVLSYFSCSMLPIKGVVVCLIPVLIAVGLMVGKNKKTLLET